MINKIEKASHYHLSLLQETDSAELPNIKLPFMTLNDQNVKKFSAKVDDFPKELEVSQISFIFEMSQSDSNEIDHRFQLFYRTCFYVASPLQKNVAKQLFFFFNS